MEFENIIAKVKGLLEGPLPGFEGQVLMAPQPLDMQRFSYHVPSSARSGAVLLLMYPSGGDCLIPFIKRPSYLGVHSAQVSFPGGKKDDTDFDLSFTAKRETEEEIGVKSSEIQILGKLSELYIPPSNFLVTPYIGFINNTPIFKPDPFEVDRVINCSFSELLNPDIRKIKSLQVIQEDIATPFYEIEKEVVWGATAMILSEFIYLWNNSSKH
jgi:8-oxo-dGTP pyrophosphatase MutT (NUDIX family)